MLHRSNLLCLTRGVAQPAYKLAARLGQARPLALLCLLGACLAGPAAWAQPKSDTSPWEKVGVYEGRTLYIDPTTARKSGSRIQIFTITDLKEPNATARGRQYFSKKALLEFDCSARTLKVLQDVWHTKHMGQGEPVFQTDGPPQGPYPVQRDSPGELLYKGACGRR
jgi:hypothetical protein